jgi:hypothetical protein
VVAKAAVVAVAIATASTGIAQVAGVSQRVTKRQQIALVPGTHYFEAYRMPDTLKVEQPDSVHRRERDLRNAAQEYCWIAPLPTAGK